MPHETRNLPATGFLRLASILGPDGPMPVSRSTWWASRQVKLLPEAL